jgi:hypothetical protein
MHEKFKVNDLVRWKHSLWIPSQVRFFIEEVVEKGLYGSGVYRVIKVHDITKEEARQKDWLFLQKIYLEDSITGETLQQSLPKSLQFWSNVWFEHIDADRVEC